ncbi:cytochrome P450 [Microlunatus ginsengisoli]|uniref:Cytochrome P450 n=1 Tax=Microlunatus ginsengisoli TaxID=363863 RepID=A0ABP7AXN7_9ACTN
MGPRREQLIFVRDFLRERAAIRVGAHLRRDPLARLHLEEGRRDPYPLYEDVRSRGPLVRSTIGAWTSVDHHVCNEILRSRSFGATGEDADHLAGSPQLSFLEMNPPDHTRLRRFALPTFSPKSVAAFAPSIQQVVDDLLDKTVGDEPFDLVGSLAAPMPIGVITRLLGVGDADADEFAHYGATFGSALGGLQSIKHAGELMRAQQALRRIFENAFEARRRDPGDDVISRLVSTEGSSVRPEEMVPLCTLLLIAGFETTVNLISNTILALLTHPDAWRRVAADPTLVEAAIEETLRWDPPVQRTARFALADATIAGHQVKKGEIVVTLLAGANRDPAVFAEPARFDLDRPNKSEHLAFSSGIHYCVGAPLARLEAIIAVRSLIARYPGLRVAGPVVRRQGSLIRGLTNFPVSRSFVAVPAG